MLRTIGLAAALMVLAAGCSRSTDAADDLPTDPGVETTPATAPATPSAAPTDAAGFVVEPGAIGPAQAGMSQDEAMATGLFDKDVDGVEGCTFPLRWKKQYDGVDVLTLQDDSIGSLGVLEGGPDTAESVGVGSTLAEVEAAYPDLTPVAEAGFGQAGASYEQDGGFIGFLFGDATVENVKDSSRVTFMELTAGSEPELMRSGC